MRKIALAVTLALTFTACGTQSTTPTPEAAQGTIALNFYKVNSQGLKAQDIFSDKTTNIRVRISNSATGFNLVKDVSVSQATSLVVAVPATSGYDVEAYSYKTGSYDKFLKHGKTSNLIVTANETTKADLLLTRPNMQIAFPTTVAAGSRFDFTVSNVPSYIDNIRLRTSTTPLTGEYFVYDIYFPIYDRLGSYTFYMNAPAQNQNGITYFYGSSFISLPGIWNTPDSNVTGLYYYYPDIDFGEAAPTASLVTPDSGTLDITVGY